MLLAGASLVQLVMATTSLRIATYFLYRAQRLPRLPGAVASGRRVSSGRGCRELTSFSVYVSIIDWSNKLNYSIDAIIIGAYHLAARRSRSGRCRSGSPRCCSG